MGCNCGGSTRRTAQPQIRDGRQTGSEPGQRQRQRRAATRPLEPGWDPVKGATAEPWPGPAGAEAASE